MKKTFKNITKLTQGLLNSGEGQNVDYKQNVNGLHSDDFVAFANSQNGGYILLGVVERQNLNGQMRGEVVGHDISDKTVLKIKSKAETCNPPIQVTVFAENVSITPFLRIKIKSGMFKPYCTQKGTYKIRADSRNEAVYPDQLLSIFMQREEQKFINRFSNATANLEQNLVAILNTVSKLESAIEERLDEIMRDINSTESEATEASSKIDQVIALIAFNSRKLESENLLSQELSKRIRGVMDAMNIEDPSRETFKFIVEKFLNKKIEETPLFQKEFLETESNSLKVSQDWVNLLGDKQIATIVNTVIEQIRSGKTN